MTFLKKILLFLVSVCFCSSLLAAPTIKIISPNKGTSNGGTTITIDGSGFTGTTAVSFGEQPAVSFTVISDNIILANAPPGTPGVVNVQVTTSLGTSPNSKFSAYVYQGDWTVYATQFATNTVIPINAQTNAIESAIIVGQSPSSVAITPDGKTAYISVATLNSVVAIDVATNSVIGAPIPVGTNPSVLAITPNGSHLYVTNFNSNSVTPINLMTTPPTPQPAIYVGINPLSIAISIDGTKAYVVNTTSNDLSIIDLATQTALPFTIPVGPRPTAIAISPNGLRAFVTHVNQNGVTEIDTTTNTSIRQITLTGPGVNAITLNSESTRFFVTNTFGNTITPYNLMTNAAEPNIVTQSRPDALSIVPDQTRVYIAHEQSFDVQVADLTVSPPIISAVIPVGSFTGEIAITPDQAPFATFSVTPGYAGQSTQFDASQSASPTGTLVDYFWDFGDGMTLHTAFPNTSHTYLSPGNYNVMLTLTNSSGTSTQQIFTGQTLRNNGGPNAQAMQQIAIENPPPLIKNINPTTGSANGGNTITLTGRFFTGATSVLFGSTPANFTIISDNLISVTAPAGNGTVNVSVITPSGTSPYTPFIQYTYENSAPPIVTQLDPNRGRADTNIVIVGQNFTGTTAVYFGSVATTFSLISDTQIVATIPAGSGQVYVQVITPNGASLTSANSLFSYTSINPVPLPPNNVEVKTITNKFAVQKEFVYLITWTSPTSGISPVAYQIYSDRKLNDLIKTVKSSQPLKVKLHEMKYRQHVYIVSVDAQGNRSKPIEIKI